MRRPKEDWGVVALGYAAGAIAFTAGLVIVAAFFGGYEMFAGVALAGASGALMGYDFDRRFGARDNKP